VQFGVAMFPTDYAISVVELGRLADTYGAGEVRLMVDQNVVLPHVPARRVARLLDEPLLRELRPDPPAICRYLVCCTGNDYCHFSLIDTKGRAVELARALEARGVTPPPGTRIHISGCIHACGKHHIADIGLLGANVRVGDEVVEAVHVFAGGRLGEDGRLAVQVLENVRFEELADVTAALLDARAVTERETPDARGTKKEVAA